MILFYVLIGVACFLLLGCFCALRAEALYRRQLRNEQRITDVNPPPDAEELDVNLLRLGLAAGLKLSSIYLIRDIHGGAETNRRLRHIIDHQESLLSLMRHGDYASHKEKP